MTHCILVGAPVDEGQRRPGCLMGPAAYRTAGLAATLATLGHTVEDRGDVVVDGADELAVQRALVLLSPGIGILLVPLAVVFDGEAVELLRMVLVIDSELSGGIGGAPPARAARGCVASDA